MQRLKNKVAIITGGARGMGAATARLFVAEGAHVMIADLLDAEGGTLAAELGPTARYQHHDVSQEDDWQQLLATTRAEFGGLDVLVNNAGVLLMRALLETTRADFQRITDVNLLGTFLGIRAAAPLLIPVALALTLGVILAVSSGTPTAHVNQQSTSTTTHP